MHWVGEGNHMLRIFFAIAMIAIGVNASLAQQDVIKERKQLMRENGNQAKLGSEMARGEKPFDLAAARKIFAQFEQTATRAATLWPQNSMDQSTADDPYSSSPKIWESMEDFRARLGRYDDAKFWYERALAVDPSHALTWSNYGMWQAEQGNVLKAEDDLEKVRLICGTNCREYKLLKAAIDGTVTY
jgi:cytochrome c556